METPKTPKIKSAEKKKKTDILTRTVGTSVFTNSVFCFSILWFFKFCIFWWKHYKVGVSAKNEKKKKLVQI